MLKKIYISLLFTLLFSLYGKEVSLTVIDRDLELPLEGVKVLEVTTGIEAFTDAEGSAILDLEESVKKAHINLQLVGYETKNITIEDFDKNVSVEMVIEGLLEGEELVVEAESIGETDAKVGVSTVIKKEIIQATSKMGIIEDAINSVKILPGVAGSNEFGSSISVRGADPSGFTAVMDGFVCKYPNHWGGVFSIFNPNIIDSIKFSPGIFSVKHGEATSALLEVNTIDPNDKLKLDTVLSTSAGEAFIQVPIGKEKKAGVLGGFRLTNYDLTVRAAGLLEQLMYGEKTIDKVIKRAPYINDFYFKSFYNPTEKLKFHINSFYGNDGIKFKADKHTIDYLNSDFIISGGTNWMITQNLLLDLTLGYENWSNTFEIGADVKGGKEDYSFQGRADLDWEIDNKHLLQGGFGTNLSFKEIKITDLEDIFSGDDEETEGESDDGITSGITIKANNESKAYMSFAYLNLNRVWIEDLINMDLGLRLDYLYYTNEGSTISNYSSTINNPPEISPRLNLTLTPEIDSDIFKDNSFSLGVGRFKKNSFVNRFFTLGSNQEDFSYKPESSITSVIGWETYLPKDLRLRVEAYYKYMEDRLYYDNYFAFDFDAEDEFNRGIKKSSFDYERSWHSVGGDLMLERELSEFLDGLLCYTYIYSTKKSIKINNGPKIRDDMKDHKSIHTLNLVMNVKPDDQFTISGKLGFISGLTTRNVDVLSLASNPNILETVVGEVMKVLYTTPIVRVDALDTNIAMPLDLKFSFHNSRKDEKSWEIYIAAQNLLSPLFKSIQDSQKGHYGLQFVDLNGEPIEDSGKAMKDIPGFPIITAGFSLFF